MPTDEPPQSGPQSPSPLGRYGSWPVVAATLIASTLIGSAVSVLLAGLISGGDVSGGGGATLLTPRTLFLAIVVSDGVLLGAVYLLLVRRGVATWKGLGLGAGEVRHPILAGLGYGLLFMLVSGSLSLALAAFGVQQDQAQQFPVAGAGVLGKAGILVAGIAFAPFAEEIFFRGFIFKAMAERKGTVRGILYSSALFALVHGNAAAFLPLLGGAVVLATAFRRSGTLWVPMMAHAFNNAVALVALVLAS